MTEWSIDVDSSWDPMPGVSIPKVISTKFHSIFLMDLMPTVEDDLDQWLVAMVEDAVEVFRTAAASPEDQIECIEQYESDLIQIIRSDASSTMDWSPLDPEDRDYPQMDLAYILCAIADDLRTRGTTRKRLLGSTDQTSG